MPKITSFDFNKSVSVKSYVTSILFSGTISLVKKVAAVASVVIPFTFVISVLTLSKHTFQIFRKSRKHLKYHRLSDLRAPKLKQLKASGKIGSIAARDHIARQHGEMIEKKRYFAPELLNELNETKNSDLDYFTFLKGLGIDKEKIDKIRTITTQKELLEKLKEDETGTIFDALLEARCKHIETVEKLLKNPLRSFAYQKQIQEKFFTDFGLARSGVRLVVTTITKIINIAAFILLPIGIITLPAGLITGLGFATLGFSLSLKLLAFGILYHYKPNTAKEQLKLTPLKLRILHFQKNKHKVLKKICELRFASVKRKLASDDCVKKWSKRAHHYQVEAIRDSKKINEHKLRLQKAGLKDFRRKYPTRSASTDAFSCLPELIYESEKQKTLSFHMKGFMRSHFELVDLSTKAKIEKCLLSYFGGNGI